MLAQSDHSSASLPLALFDVDGTLTPARREASKEMLAVLQALRKKAKVAIVGGSDISKIIEQLGPDTCSAYDYVFAENGTVAFKDGKPFGEAKSFKTFLGPERFAELEKFLRDYIEKVDVPVKTSNFVEVRTGMLNVSPIGRSCSQAQRDEFYAYDKIHKVRETLVKEMQTRFGDWGLKFSIGGQISVDVFPVGWDKTLCLEYLEEYKDIYFFGDKTEPGGNDYEIFTCSRVYGHSVTSPEHTTRLLYNLFLIPLCSLPERALDLIVEELSVGEAVRLAQVNSFLRRFIESHNIWQRRIVSSATLHTAQSALLASSQTQELWQRAYKGEHSLSITNHHQQTNNLILAAEIAAPTLLSRIEFPCPIQDIIHVDSKINIVFSTVKTQPHHEGNLLQSIAVARESARVVLARPLLLVEGTVSIVLEVRKEEKVSKTEEQLAEELKDSTKLYGALL
jgi:phosphomannomutase